MRQRKLTFALMIVAMAIIVSGCTLFGTQPGTSQGNMQDKLEVERTIEALTVAGENQDAAGVEAYIASSVFLEILDDSEDGFSDVIQGDAEVLRSLRQIWDGGQLGSVHTEINDIVVHGGRAEVAGSFAIDFTVNSGQHFECTGYVTATLDQNGNVWQITSAVVSDAACLIDGELPDEEPPTDEEDETSDPSNPSDPGNRVYHDDFSEAEFDQYLANGHLNFTFQTCEYLVSGTYGDGTSSNQIKAVQESLKHLGYLAGLTDGYYGPMTADAVRAFQSDHGLYVDGEFGPKTLAVFDEVLRSRGGSFECDQVETEPNHSTTLTMSSLRRGTAFETPVYTYEGPVAGPTIVFVGCIHGNERSGHLTLVDIIDRGITIDRGKLIIIPALNKIACEQNRRTLSRSGSLLSGKDFNRMFPVGRTPTYTIAKELWDILRTDPNLAFVVDFHDGFINSLGNTLLHTRQSKASTVANRIRNSLNQIRPSGARGPVWRAFSEPVSGSLIRKVGRDLGVPGILVELSGRNPGDPLSLRKRYAERIITMVGQENGMRITF